MSDLGSKIKYFFGLESDDEAEKTPAIEDEETRDFEERRPPRREARPRTEPTTDYKRPEYRTTRPAAPSSRPEVVEPKYDRSKMIICKYTPVDFRESTSMIDDIRQGHPVIINFENTEDYIAAKIVNICEGAAYALDADISKIANAIFIIVPQGVNLMTNKVEDVVRDRDLEN